MKIAMPVDEKNMETNVCVSFGRAPYFLIYDMDTKKAEFMDNTAAASAGGAGIKAAQAVVDTGVSALLSPRCGKNAADVIEAGDIKIYKTVKQSVQENIDAFAANELELLDEIHAGHHGN